MNPEILPINKIRGLLLLILMAGALISLGGCELLYFLGGNNEDKALYKIPKSDRVLVLVDSSAGSPMTMQAAGSLIDAVNSQLYQNKAANQLVPSFRVMEIERTNPVAYQQMGIADLAKSVNADLVVYIFLDRFNVQLDSDQEISQGDAVGMVKVVDSGGRRLWPDDATEGYPVTARVKEDFTLTQTSTDVQNQLIGELSVNIGQLFYSHAESDNPSNDQPDNQLDAGQ